jgi:hypothetical protein
MPLSARVRRGKEATVTGGAPSAAQPEAALIVHANAPRSKKSGGSRPYLLGTLQHHFGSYILADTLDWDGEILKFAPFFPFFFFFKFVFFSS